MEWRAVVGLAPDEVQLIVTITCLRLSKAVPSLAGLCCASVTAVKDRL